VVYSFVEIVRSIKGLYVMSVYELIKFDEELPPVKDRTLAKPVEQESPFCYLDANSDIENGVFEIHLF
jgi:hypothetical protein